MKKRFNIYCTLMFAAMIVAIAVDFGTNIKDYVDGFAEGWNAGDVQSQKTGMQRSHLGVHKDFTKEEMEHYSNDMVPVYLRPKVTVSDTRMKNLKTGKMEEYQIWSAMFYINPESTEAANVYEMLGLLAGLVTFVCIIWMLVEFIYLIKKVNRGELFVDTIVKKLRRLGVLVLVYYATVWVTEISSYLIACECVELKDYEVTYEFTNNVFMLVTGIGLLLLAEIFKMGKEMKDEQELTI